MLISASTGSIAVYIDSVKVNLPKLSHVVSLDRFYWEDFDPIFVSEAAMAFANLLTFLRLSIYLGFNQQVGPLQITLGKMINVSLAFF